MIILIIDKPLSVKNVHFRTFYKFDESFISLSDFIENVVKFTTGRKNMKNTKIEEISKFDIIKKVLQENGRITLKDAIEKAKALKILKVKDENNVWRYTFVNASKFGVIKLEIETFVELTSP